MITRGEIQAIDYTSNLCTVRIPIFEGPGNVEKAIFSAVMNIPPGVHSGYKAGDVVFVGFVDNSINKPVVLGKLYLGPTQGLAEEEHETGFVSCAQLEAETKVTLPSPSEVYFKSTASDGIFGRSAEQYTTLGKLIEKVNELETKLGNLKWQ